MLPFSALSLYIIYLLPFSVIVVSGYRFVVTVFCIGITDRNRIKNKQRTTSRMPPVRSAKDYCQETNILDGNVNRIILSEKGRVSA